MTAFIQAILSYLKDNWDVISQAPIASALLLCIGFGLGYGWLRKEANASKELLKLKEEKLENLKKEFSDLQEENKKLKESPKKDIELTLKGKFYYKQDDERPFCPVCYESTQKNSLLVEELRGVSYQYKCFACNATFRSERIYSFGK